MSEKMALFHFTLMSEMTEATLEKKLLDAVEHCRKELSMIDRTLAEHRTSGLVSENQTCLDSDPCL
jgi:hypothetical protein